MQITHFTCDYKKNYYFCSHYYEQIWKLKTQLHQITQKLHGMQRQWGIR